MKKLIVIISLLMLTGCVSSKGGPNVKTIDNYPPEVETASNQSEELPPKPQKKYKSDYDLLESEDISEYLNGIKEKLLAQWPQKAPENIQIFVTANGQFDAKATPFDIIITMGVLNKVKTEDELAFVIAHELSHILLKHIDVRDYFKQQEKLINFASKVAIVAAVVEDIQVSDTSGKLTIGRQNKSSTQRKMRDAYKTALAINTLSNDLIDSFLNREDEKEADFLGLDLLTKAGYSLAGYPNVLNLKETSVKETKESLKKEKEKYQKIVTTLSSDKIPQGDNSLKMLAYLAGNEMVTGFLKDLAEKYYGHDKRREDLTEYVNQHYEKEKRSPQKKTELDQSLKSGNSKQILENYVSAYNASESLKKNKLKEAESFARQSVSGITKYHAYPRNIFAQIRYAQNNHKKAAQNMNLIKNWKYASYKTALRASKYNQLIKQYDKAIITLKHSANALGDDASFYPEMIDIYKKQGNVLKMASTLEQCKAQDNEGIKNDCLTRAGEKKTGKPKKSNTFNIFGTLKKAISTD